MAFTVINPPHARPVASYTMAVRVESGRLIHTGTIGPFLNNGRVAWPGDLAGQTRRILENLVDRLRSDGATLSDIVKMTTYLVRMADLPEFAQVRSEFIRGTLPPATLIGVARFSQPDVLAQIEVVAVID
jgi:2-iminobutanoate/2-iminopropanoate deaminase